MSVTATVSPAINNSIGLAAEYLPLLDEIYKAESKTAILDTAQDRVRWSNDTHSFYLFETDMVGLGNYYRNGGFVRGDVTATWRQYTPQYDRARQFLVDRLDNAESMGMAFVSKRFCCLRRCEFFHRKRRVCVYSRTVRCRKINID